MTVNSDHDEPHCIVCGGETEPHFTKDFKGECGLGEVHYRRCISCGFGFSATHYALSAEDWGELNAKYHLSFFGSNECDDDPRWFERLTQQSEVLSLLWAHSTFANDLAYYDYGCGDGKLADLLASKGMNVRKYDKFLGKANDDYLTDTEVESGNFGLVINTSVMEHVRDLATLDSIAASVHPERGVLAMHTWVGEEVPADESWFYLLPVHISFFTNSAMRLLVSRWGFAASLYVVEPRMYFLFRDEPSALAAFELLRSVRDDVFHGAGFVAYWT